MPLSNLVWIAKPGDCAEVLAGKALLFAVATQRFTPTCCIIFAPYCKSRLVAFPDVICRQGHAGGLPVLWKEQSMNSDDLNCGTDIAKLNVGCLLRISQHGAQAYLASRVQACSCPEQVSAAVCRARFAHNRSAANSAERGSSSLRFDHNRQLPALST